MDTNDKSCLFEILHKYEQELLAEWMVDQLFALTLRRDLIKDAELHEQSRQFLSALREAVQQGSLTDITTADWREVRELLASISHLRAQQGFTSAETATFIFSFKQPLFTRLHKELEQQPQALAEAIWASTMFLDKLGLYTTEVSQKSREEIIARQQQELLELSTPVLQRSVERNENVNGRAGR